MPTPVNHSGETLNITLRPREFSDVIGLENEIKAIRHLIDSGKLPRAFFIYGPFGTGKTTLSYIIAKEVQGFEFADVRPQIQEVNAANVTGIDAMRKLIESAGSYPMIGRYGVIILDEAHKLSKAAQEALLKEFESETSPTIWIICTTDPEKLAEGLKAGRCFPLATRGMDAEARKQLVERAAHERAHTGDLTEFLEAVSKARVVSPRKILMAFEAYNAGIPAVQAVGTMSFETSPEYWDICMGVVFGQWDKKYSLPWIKGKDGQAKQCAAVTEQLKALDDKLKKKPKADNATPTETPATATDDDTSDAEDDDAQGKPEVAAALRAITAGILKGQIIRADAGKFNGSKAQRAADSLFILAHCVGPNGFGTEFSAVIGGLYRVNQKMQGK